MNQADLIHKLLESKYRSSYADTTSSIYSVLDPTLWFSIFYSQQETLQNSKGKEVNIVDYFYKSKVKTLKNPYGDSLNIVETEDKILKYICEYYKVGYIPAFHLELTNANITKALKKNSLPQEAILSVMMQQKALLFNHLDKNLPKTSKTIYLMHITTENGRPITNLKTMEYDEDYDYGHHMQITFNYPERRIEYFDSVGRGALDTCTDQFKNAHIGGSATVFRWLCDYVNTSKNSNLFDSIIHVEEEKCKPSLQDGAEHTCQNWSMLYAVARASGLSASAFMNMFQKGLSIEKLEDVDKTQIQSQIKCKRHGFLESDWTVINGLEWTVHKKPPEWSDRERNLKFSEKIMSKLNSVKSNTVRLKLTQEMWDEIVESNNLEKYPFKGSDFFKYTNGKTNFQFFIAPTFEETLDFADIEYGPIEYNKVLQVQQMHMRHFVHEVSKGKAEYGMAYGLVKGELYDLLTSFSFQCGKDCETCEQNSTITIHAGQQQLKYEIKSEDIKSSMIPPHKILHDVKEASKISDSALTWRSSDEFCEKYDKTVMANLMPQPKTTKLLKKGNRKNALEDDMCKLSLT